MLEQMITAAREAFALRWANLKWYFTPYQPSCRHSSEQCSDCEYEEWEQNYTA